MVEALVEEDLDGGHGGVAKAGRQRRAELGELYVVEPVLEASLEEVWFFFLVFTVDFVVVLGWVGGWGGGEKGRGEGFERR